MPIVPVVQRQVQVGGLPGQAASPQLPSTAPSDAFGGGAGIGEGLNKAASAYDKYAAEANKSANESAMTGLDLEASHEQTRIELEARKMEGKDAAGAMDYAQKEWGKVQDRLKEKAANQDQADGISKILSARYSNIDRVVQTHTSDELTKFDQNQSDSYLAAQSEEAINNYQDPKRVAQARILQDDEIGRLGSRHGWSPEMVAQKKLDSGSLTNTAIVTRMLDSGDYKSASAYYEQNKAAFSPKDILHVEKSLESGKDLMMGKDAWNQYQGFRLSDGNPDEGKMEKAVLADPNTNDFQKEKILTFVKAKAADARSRKAEGDKAKDRSFLNTAIEGRKNGVPLEAALPIANRFSQDSYDQALKEDAIRQIYAPSEVKTDPATKVALMDGIDEGTINKDQIDKAKEKGMLSPADWVSMRERYHTVVSEGKSPQQQRANEQLKILAKGRFGSDADGMNSFLSEIKSDAAGKSPEEMIKIANDKLKQDEGSTTRFWNWVPYVGGESIPGTGQPQYETDIEKRTAGSLVKGKLQEDLGVETVKAIELGNIRSGSKASAAETIDAMSVSLGGYDKLKPGAPAYNAMQSLSRAGKVVTADAVKKVLEYYPDGNFTSSSAIAASRKVGKLPRGRR